LEILRKRIINSPYAKFKCPLPQALSEIREGSKKLVLVLLSPCQREMSEGQRG
jgi:hypothetical protein